MANIGDDVPIDDRGIAPAQADADIEGPAMEDAATAPGAAVAAAGAAGPVDLDMQEEGQDGVDTSNTEAKMDTDTMEGAKSAPKEAAVQEPAYGEDAQMQDLANNTQGRGEAIADDKMDDQIADADEADEDATDAEQRKRPRVADLTWEGKQQALKNYWQAGWWRDYQLGDCVDAVDTVQKWCVATTIGMEEAVAELHFDGWSSRWDVSYRWASGRIAPFRRCSQGYTGQPKTPLRQNMTFDLKELHAAKARVEAVIAAQFQGMTAHETTQYLRGRLFVYTDFLLSANTGSYSEEETEEIDEYLRAVVRLVVAWLRKATEIVKTAGPDLRRDSDLFLVDEDVALLASCPEVMGLLDRLLCGCHRCLRYYLHRDKDVQTFANPVTEPQLAEVDFRARRQPEDQDYDVELLRERVLARDRDLVFGQALNFLNYFAEAGGFEALLTLLKEGNARPPEKPGADKKDDKADNELLPLDLLGELTSPFLHCAPLMSKPFARQFVQQVQDIVTQRLMEMRDKEIKELDKDTLAGLIASFRTFLRIAKPAAEIAELAEQIELSFATRFLKTTYLEKRLQGLSDLRRLADGTGARWALERQRQKRGETGQPGRLPAYLTTAGGAKIRPTEHLDRASLRDWMIQEKVAETLFAEGSHPELLKRAAPIVRFLCQQNAINQEIVDMIWKCQQGKHEETVRVVYGLITEIALDLPTPLLDSLYQKIAEVPQAQYTEMYLLFLKDFTMKAFELADRVDQQAQRARAREMEAANGQDGEEEAEEEEDAREAEVFQNLKEALAKPESVALADGEKLYGMPIFWMLLQDGYEASSDLSGTDQLELVLDAVREILSQPYSQKIRMFYLLKALGKLIEGKSLYSSIAVFTCIMEMQGSSAARYSGLSRAEALKQLEEQLGLVQVILQDIMRYDEEVKEVLKQLVRQNKAPPESVENHVFCGRMGHRVTLGKLLEILEFVILASDWEVTIKAENLETLWTTFVLRPNFTSDQAQFLSFINKKRTRTHRMPPDAAGYVARTTQEINLLTAEVQRHFFTQILCNPTFIDYQKLTTGQAKCFHTYFRLINQEEGHLEQYRGRVQVRSFENLVGLDGLWRITFESDNEKAREESGELLVDLHLRLAPEYEASARRQIMLAFIDRSFKSMVELSETIKSEGAEAKLLGIIQVLSKFLNKYEGKKPIKPELKALAMQFSTIQPVPVTVLLAREGAPPQEARMHASQFETMGAVRERCAALFGLDLNEFEMRLRRAYHSVVDPEEDDDRYVKDHGISSQIFLTRNPAYDKLGHPKHLIAAKQEYFELLFALLAKGTQKLVEPVWELLQKLPVNHKLHADIKELRGAQESWDRLLDSSSAHKLLYSLKIIDGLSDKGFAGPTQNAQANSQDPEQDETKDLSTQSKTEGESAQAAAARGAIPGSLDEWKQRFIQLGGFQHLLTTFTSLQMGSLDSKLTLRCLGGLLTALMDFTIVDASLQNVILEQREAVVGSCLRYIHLIGLHSLEVEQQRGEAIEDLQAKRAQKRRAKWKLRQLQMAGTGNEGRRRGQQQAQEEEGSDDEDDSEQLRLVYGEFATSKRLLERLYDFMARFIFQRDKGSLAFVASFPQLSELVRVTLVESENSALRAESGRRLRDVLVSCSGEPALKETLSTVLRVILIEVLPAIQGRERRSAQYFDQVGRTIRELQVADMDQLEDELALLMQKQAAAIQVQPSPDSTGKHEDRGIAGLMALLGVLLQKYPKRKAEIGSQLIPHLLQQCLLQVAKGPGVPDDGSKVERRSPACRAAGLRLLPVLMRDCLANLQLVLDYIAQFSRSASWRTNKASDWAIARADDEKSSTGYVGLKNLGCICYMISLFQQLFMIPSLRDDILAVEDPNHDNQEPGENMLYQFQAIFAGLLKSEKQYVNPKGFCHAFKDWEGQPTNVLEQMDVEEFLQMFLDRLETAIKGTPQEKTIQYHFGGKLASEMICKGCPHQYERSEPFLSIGVPVKNKRTLQEGLNAFVQGDMLEGDNAYFCAKCDKKIDTLKRYCVKELPRYLLISLKRFEFDFDRGIRVKVNDYCEFPAELDMLPYTQEGLSRRERAAKQKQEAVERGEEYQEVDEPLKHPRDYYEFKLKGMVVHTGTADSGHYYSFIREHRAPDKQGSEEKWYEFNDNVVRDFDVADLPNECFGGEEFYSGPGMSNMKTPKWRNAYLVIYERKSQEEAHAEEEESQGSVPAKDAKENDGDMPDDDEKAEKKLKPTDPEHPIQKQIALENQKYWHGKYLFASEYFEFVSDVTHFWDMANIIPLSCLNKNNDAHLVGHPMRTLSEAQAQVDLVRPADEVFDLRVQHADDPQRVRDAAHQVFKFAAGFYLTILQRAQAKSLVPRLIGALKAYLNSDPRNGLWLLNEVSNWEIIKEMLLQPESADMPKLTVGLLYCAMLTVYDSEKGNLRQHWTELEQHNATNPTEPCQGTSLGVLGNLVLLLISHLYELKDFTLNMPQYFQLLARFASLGPEARDFLLRASIVGRCMALFFGNAGARYRERYQDMSGLGPIRTTEQPDIGLPTAWDAKMRTYFQALLERRRRQRLATAPAKYKYLLELVSLCVRHLNIGGAGQGPYWLDPGQATLTTFVDPDEADLCSPDAAFLRRVYAGAKRSRAMWAVARAHCHYASQDPDLVAELFRTALPTLDQRDYDEIRPFLCLLEVLLETPHANFVAKRKEWLEQFMDVVQNNLAYYRWMETVIEFIFKIVSKQPAVRDWFYANPQKWGCLTDWARQHSRPPHPTQATEGNRLLKSRPNQEQAMLSALQRYNAENSSPGRSALNAAYRRKRLQMMLNQAVPDLSEEVDPDRGDLQDYKFLPGDIVYLVDRKRDEAERWRVVTVFDEMISLGLEGDAAGRVKWQKCDTDKLVLEEVYDQLARNRVRRELLEPAAGRGGNAGQRGRGGYGGARAGSDDQDPEQAWQGAEDAGQGAPQDGTGESDSDVDGYDESEGDAELYT